MGCSSSKPSDVRRSHTGSIPGSLRGVRRKVALPSARSAKRSHGKVHQNADLQQPALSKTSWPELNILLCKLKQETPMFNASCGAATLREIISTPEPAPGLQNNTDGKIEPPLDTRPRRPRRTMSVSVIHTVEDVDAAMRKASEKMAMRDDFAVDYRQDRGSAEQGIAEEPRKDQSPSVAANYRQDRGSAEQGIAEEPRKDQSPAVAANFRESDSPVFDPETLEAFESAAEEVSEGSPAKLQSAPEKFELAEDLLERFECRCPPNGEHRAVLYTTSLRGIRKTYEDCQRARVIVESYGVSVDERDVSMHFGFLRELKTLTEDRAVVPKLFIRGKYVGGAEEIVELHDDGKLAGLLGGLPRGKKPCEGCGGLHFFPCVKCNGSCKVVVAEGGFEVSRCSDCNENGLIRCPLCSSSASSPSRPL